MITLVMVNKRQPKKGRVLILKHYENGRVPTKKGRGSTLLIRHRQITANNYYVATQVKTQLKKNSKIQFVIKMHSSI